MSNILIIANVFGYIGLSLLFIQVVFGSRHIFKNLTTNTVLVNKMHKYIGIYGMVFVFLHPGIMAIERFYSVSWTFLLDFSSPLATQVSFGKIAFGLFLIVWITSAIVREKMKWRPWKYLHLLSYPIVFFAFIHVVNLGSFFQEYLLVKFVWAFLFMIFGLSLVVRVLAFAGYGKTKYKLIEQKLVGDDIVLIRLEPISGKLDSQIGQHFFLQAGRFRSEHPFTIIRNEDGVLYFGIRRVGGFWNEFLDKRLGSTIYIDGPYGVFTKEAQNLEPKVVISAGIGVTPFVDLVDNFGENTVYINCNRKINEAVERDLLKRKTEKYIDIVNEYSGPEDNSVKVGLINTDTVVNAVGENYKNVPYFICGSPGFISAIKKILTDLKVPKSKIYYEELGF